MLSGDAALRDPANAVSATVITTGVGPVNPAMLPGDDVQVSVEDFAMFPPCGPAARPERSGPRVVTVRPTGQR